MGDDGEVRERFAGRDGGAPVIGVGRQAREERRVFGSAIEDELFECVAQCAHEFLAEAGFPSGFDGAGAIAVTGAGEIAFGGQEQEFVATVR